MYACMPVCVCVYAYMPVCICTRMYVHYVCTYVCACFYVCMYDMNARTHGAFHLLEIAETVFIANETVARRQIIQRRQKLQSRKFQMVRAHVDLAMTNR